MKQQVVSLADRGRGLEWLSLGFGIWLIAAVVAALLSVEIRERIAGDPRQVAALQETLGLVAIGLQVAAIAAIAIGAAYLVRSGSQLWFATALGALALILVGRTVFIWLPLIDPETYLELTRWLRTASIIGSIAQLVLVLAVLQGLREIARAERVVIPPTILGGIIAAELVRALTASSLQVGENLTSLGPWGQTAFFTGVAVVEIGLLLLAIRVAGAAVRAQIWAGQPGATSPARAADWKRTAAGLDWFGAFLIAKVAIAAAAFPLFLFGLLLGLPGVVDLQDTIVRIASALASAAMAAAMVASRRLPDPPDARTGFTGAALLIAACVVSDVYVLRVRANQPLAATISSLGHLVAYLAVLRSVARIGERLGEEEMIRRARALGWLAVIAVGGATIAGYLLQRGVADLGVAIATPIAVAGIAFAVFLPCAMLSRQLARRLRQRFAEPPRAVARARVS